MIEAQIKIILVYGCKLVAVCMNEGVEQCLYVSAGPAAPRVSVACVCFRMLEYQQQIAGLEGDCRDLRSYLQVGDVT